MDRRQRVPTSQGQRPAVREARVAGLVFSGRAKATDDFIHSEVRRIH
jgi:hypothetical protein